MILVITIFLKNWDYSVTQTDVTCREQRLWNPQLYLPSRPNEKYKLFSRTYINAFVIKLRVSCQEYQFYVPDIVACFYRYYLLLLYFSKKILNILFVSTQRAYSSVQNVANTRVE